MQVWAPKDHHNPFCYPNDIWIMDLWQLSREIDTFKYVLEVVDSCSKFAWWGLLHDKTSNGIAEALRNILI